MARWLEEREGDTHCKRVFSLWPEAASLLQAGLKEAITSASRKRKGVQIFLINLFLFVMKVFLFTQENLSSCDFSININFLYTIFCLPGWPLLDRF